MPDTTLILQSHPVPLPHDCLQPALHSVQQWAERRGYEYLCIGDELFDSVPTSVLSKTRREPVIATDIGRLQWMQRLLARYEAVLWLDADTLVIEPDALILPAADFAVGRETWIQSHGGRPKLYRKVHNAALLARQGGSSLPFYLDAALRILDQHAGGMPPQVVGPKLLTALHNLVRFAVIEAADVLPPTVAQDLLNGGGAYLDAYCAARSQPPGALNLCTSSLKRGDLSPQEMAQLIAYLQTDGSRMRGHSGKLLGS